jgi:hypothetical protein
LCQTNSYDGQKSSTTEACTPVSDVLNDFVNGSSEFVAAWEFAASQDYEED